MFDEDKLTEQLSTLPVRHRLAFAASCCERLIPNHYAFSRMEEWGNSSQLRQALDEVWEFLKGNELSEMLIGELMQRCEAQAPETEDFSSLFVSAAGDAAAAVVYTLECCLDGDANRAALVGRLAVDTIYQYLLRVNDPQVGIHGADYSFEEQMLNAPLMVAELEKQQQDLVTLKSQSTLSEGLLLELRRSSSLLGIRPFERGLVKNG